MRVIAGGGDVMSGITGDAIIKLAYNTVNGPELIAYLNGLKDAGKIGQEIYDALIIRASSLEPKEPVI